MSNKRMQELVARGRVQVGTTVKPRDSRCRNQQASVRRVAQRIDLSG